MKTWVHFLVSSILAIIFYPVFNWKVLFIIGLASHYILDIIWQYSVLNRLIINPSAISWLYKNKIQKV